MKHTLLPVLCLTLCLTLAGCAAADPDTAYDPDSFVCTLAIDSISTGESGYFLAEYVRDAGSTLLTITSPERLAGLSFAFSESGCVMDAGGTAVPLSTATAASLRELAELLCASPDAALDRKKTSDGTVLVFPQGQLTLNDAGLPILAETTDGRRAAITAVPTAE